MLDQRTFEYDTAGNLLAKVDRDGRRTEFTYDDLGRVTQELWKDALGNVVNTIALAYDGASRLTSISDDFSAYAYSYDDAGQLTGVDNTGTPDMPVFALAYGYDGLGRRTSTSATVDSTADFTNTHQYDAAGRVTRIEQSGTGIAAKRVDIGYDPLGNFDAITRYADLAGTDLVATTDYTFDQAGRLTDLTHSKGASTLAGYTTTWGG